MDRTLSALIITLLLLIPFVLFGNVVSGQEDAAVPLTIEVKADDYVVVDKEVHRQLIILKQQNDELHGMVGLLLERTDTLAEVDPEPSPLPTVYINTGTFEELITIHGIGKVTAEAIIATRGTPELPGYDPFSDWSDLIERVRWIGEGTVSNFQEDGILLNPLPEETTE